MSISAAAGLRRRAEVQLKTQASETGLSGKESETQRLHHELQVHQIELEMQNTELRQSRNEAEKSLEKYTDLYDFARVSYFTLNRNGDIRNVNFRAASYLGIDRSNLLGRRFGQFVTAASRPAFSAFLSTAFSSSDKASCEVAFLNGGNLPLFAQIEAVAISSGEKCQIAVTDISERKRAEATLRVANDELETRVRERTEELAASVEILRDEINERKRMEGSLLRLNRLYAVVGETNQAIVRAGNRDSLFHDFCRIAVEQGGFILSSVGLVDMESGQVRSVAAYGATDYLNDIRLSAKDEPNGIGPTGISIREGIYYICNDFLSASCTEPWHERGRTYGIKASASVPLRDKGAVIGALTLYAGEKDYFDPQHVDLLVQMGADVSFALDNLAREACRQHAEQTLREEIMERLQAVESLRAKEQMFTQQNRLAGMGEMINSIAHQWRQPLNVLGLMVQQMQIYYEMGNFSKEFLDTSVNKSMSLINHMSQTISDFMNFFKQDKEKVEFAVHEVVARTVSLIEDNFKSQQVRIDLKIDADPVIIGFPNEYCQVLLNILTNARDALLERRPDDATITVIINSQQGKSVVTISDNAGGIAADAMGKIFDPYFTTKGPDKGTGVGLFMSKTIIEKNMNGKLTARNSVKGAEFRIEV